MKYYENTKKYYENTKKYYENIMKYYENTMKYYENTMKILWNTFLGRRRYWLITSKTLLMIGIQNAVLSHLSPYVMFSNEIQFALPCHSLP